MRNTWRRYGSLRGLMRNIPARNRFYLRPRQPEEIQPRHRRSPIVLKRKWPVLNLVLIVGAESAGAHIVALVYEVSRRIDYVGGLVGHYRQVLRFGAISDGNAVVRLDAEHIAQGSVEVEAAVLVERNKRRLVRRHDVEAVEEWRICVG